MKVEELIKTDKPIPLESRTIIHINLVSNKINEVMNQAIKPYGISLQQFNVLRILRGQKGKPANLSTVNERMVTKMSNTTRLIDKLIIKGYVNRVVCPSNRRKIEITITPKGETDLIKIDKAIALAQEEILQDLSKQDLKELNQLLDKF